MVTQQKKVTQQEILNFLKEGEKFILTNGKKCLDKELRDPTTLPKRKKEIEDILKGCSIYSPVEQKNLIFPGNGVDLKINGVFCIGVLDGSLEITRHCLPPEYLIILSSSDLGRALMLKREGDIFRTTENGEVKLIEVKNIYLPSETKWLFQPMAEEEEVAA
ncbi:MAG TPA: hypothetical protein VFQ59_03060 [Candidatus Paceibacterota bacterium]|nr:hypothetical protein [Candidatus Paceibacterota bacterium]